MRYSRVWMALLAVALVLLSLSCAPGNGINDVLHGSSEVVAYIHFTNLTTTNPQASAPTTLPEIRGARADGSGTPVTLLPGDNYSVVVTAADGNRIAFVKLGTLYTASWLSPTPQQIATNVYDASLTADGSKVAYSLTGQSGAQNFLANADGTGSPQQIGTSTYVKISPDGLRTLLVGPEVVQLCNGIGSSCSNVTLSPSASTYSLVFSPDSNHLAYQKYDGTSIQIYLAGLDGSGEVKLTNVTSGAVQPQPLRTRIGFISLGNPTQVNTILPDGTGQVQVTNDPAGISNWFYLLD